MSSSSSMKCPNVDHHWSTSIIFPSKSSIVLSASNWVIEVNSSPSVSLATVGAVNIANLANSFEAA